MAELTYSGYHKLTRSTVANAYVEPIHYKVKAEHFQEKPTIGLAEAGDTIAIRNMPANTLIHRMQVWVPPGKNWGAGAIDIGWTLEGAHPDDVHQDSTHNTPRVDETLFNDPVYFGAGIVPAPGTGAAAEAIVGMPKQMLDLQYREDKAAQWLGYNWNLTITPSGAPAVDDELYMLMHYYVVAT